MKLYTRSEIIKMLDFFQVNDDTIVQFIDKLESIELPSDEKIMKEASKSGILSSYKAFLVGVKWMKEQILNQNK